MTSGVSVSSAWAEAASASNSFSWAEAVVIFVVVIVALLVIVALVGRRTRLLVSRPGCGPRTAGGCGEAAEEDVAEIERDARLYGRPVRRSRRREDDLWCRLVSRRIRDHGQFLPRHAPFDRDHEGVQGRRHGQGSAARRPHPAP